MRSPTCNNVWKSTPDNRKVNQRRGNEGKPATNQKLYAVSAINNHLFFSEIGEDMTRCIHSAGPICIYGRIIHSSLLTKSSGFMKK